MPNHMNRGPHTGMEPGTLASDMDASQRKSIISNFDYDELIKIQLPPAAGIHNVAVFDLEDVKPVGATSQKFTSRFNSDPTQLRTLVDRFTIANAPAAPPVPAEESKDFELGGGRYTVSGPRGGQFPLELAVLHGKLEDGGADDVLFASVTASVLVLVQADPAVADKQQRERSAEDAALVKQEKETIWSAVRAFTQALTSRGL
ncbi:hypothetical protein CF326_g7915 [Tilletia indica]|nr:hypothetical protein CF326_g7915 [Tilletia indica]